MNSARSPWWYRQRGPLFAALYVVSFVLGESIWGLLGNFYEPFYRVAGAHLGANGPAIVLSLAIASTALCFGLRVWGSSYLSAGKVWNPDARPTT